MKDINAQGKPASAFNKWRGEYIDLPIMMALAGLALVLMFPLMILAPVIYPLFTGKRWRWDS